MLGVRASGECPGLGGTANLRMLERDAARDQPLGADVSVRRAARNAHGDPDGEERNQDHDSERSRLPFSSGPLSDTATISPTDAAPKAVPRVNMIWNADD